MNFVHMHHPVHGACEIWCEIPTFTVFNLMTKQLNTLPWAKERSIQTQQDLHAVFPGLPL